MAKEIEKKFLLKENGVYHYTSFWTEIYPSWIDVEIDILGYGKKIRQGYMPLNSGIALARTLGMNLDFNPEEARLRDKAGKFYFTIKGDGNLSRNEIEEEIDKDLFERWWDLTLRKRVEKVRLNRNREKYVLEIDLYTDRDLAIVEIEVPSIEIANSLTPLGKDVTENPLYKNKNLAK